METLRLRFVPAGQADLPLGIGMHGIGRLPGSAQTIGIVAEGQPALARLCVDRRGIWLTVSEGQRGVHVNGREVRRLAMLRIGDAVYLEGVEIRLTGLRPVEPPPLDGHADAEPDPRVVLRGVGGQHHGRCFTLERPRLVGSAADADIRIDDPAFAEHHARLELSGGRVILRDLGAEEDSLVNGVAVREAVLLPGDQVVFDAHHRFVVEAPLRGQASHGTFADGMPDPPRTPVRAAAGRNAAAGRGRWRLPWLLLAALLLAGLLSLLLLYGVG